MVFGFSVERVVINLSFELETWFDRQCLISYFVSYEFDTDHETFASHISDNVKLLAHLGKLLQEIGSNNMAVLLEFLFVDDLRKGKLV